MATYSTKKLKGALTNKGYKEKQSHHTMYLYYHNDKKTHIITKISQGETEFNEAILAERRKQMRLPKKKDFLDFMECPLSHQDYAKILLDNGHLENIE